MKRQSKSRGGGPRPGEQTITKYRQGHGKIFSPKEAKLKHDILAELGREAAYDELCDEEECRQLTGQYARESAKRTDRNIGDIWDRYETIVMELLAARYTTADSNRYSLGTVLRSDCETDGKLKEFLKELGLWIELYVVRCICREPIFHWKLDGNEDVRVETLRRHAVSEGLMTALCLEYVMDRRGLKQFLWAVFKHWRKIFEPRSLWVVRLITQQHLGKPRVVAQYLENIGAVSQCTTLEQRESLRGRIKQYRTRDRKNALKKRQKAR
jgi:hypothetical protein